MANENLSINDYVALYESGLRNKDQLLKALDAFEKKDLIEFILSDNSEEDDGDGKDSLF